MKTPEQYFVEDVRLPDVTDPGRTLTGAEEAFLDKYLGVDREKVLAQARRLDPRGDDSLADFSGSEDAAAIEHSDENMRNQKDIRLVSFTLMGREFALPITVIQEVIRFVKPTKLPAAPYFITGIINLRGRVTPLVSLRLIMGIPGDQEDRFIVI
ncbi:MAG: chemotaxis protein CheW, partial [Humidesulfovibrio sp.]|nr:chemotaxis protein CheW [Humidesulfovibrio sp.]